MGKKSTASRRQRRMELRRANFLKIKNMYRRMSPQSRAWYDKMQKDGKEMHLQFTNRMNDAREERLEATLNSLKETWSSIGYNSEEIEMLSDAWMLTVILDPDRVQARSDKKESRRLTKAAQTSLTQRLAA